MASAGNLSRNLGQAKAAFEQNNVEESKNAHKAKQAGEINESGHGGDLFLMYWWGWDGLATACMLLAVFFSIPTVAALGSTRVCQLSMGCLAGISLTRGGRAFLRTMSDVENFHRERSREAWELDNYPEGEVEEMVELYVAKGMKEVDARATMGLMSKYKELFVDLMMAQELVLMLPDGTPLQNAIREAGGFFVISCIPLAAVFGLDKLGIFGHLVHLYRADYAVGLLGVSFPVILGMGKSFPQIRTFRWHLLIWLSMLFVCLLASTIASVSFSLL